MENTTQTSIASAPLTAESSASAQNTSAISSLQFARFGRDHTRASFSSSDLVLRQDLRAPGSRSATQASSSGRARADTAGTGTATLLNAGRDSGPSEESPVHTPSTEISQPMLVDLSDVDVEMQRVRPREKRGRRMGMRVRRMKMTREVWMKVGVVVLGLIIDPAGSVLGVVFGVFCLVSALSVAIPLVLMLPWSRRIRGVLPLNAYKMLHYTASFLTVVCALVNVVLVACRPPANACRWDLDGLWVPMGRQNAACASVKGVKMGVAVARLVLTLIVVIAYLFLAYALLRVTSPSSPIHDLEEGYQTEFTAPIVTRSTHIHVEKKYSDSSFSAFLERLRLKRVAQPTPAPTPTAWSGSTTVVPSSGSGCGSNWLAPWDSAPGSSGGRTPTPPTPAYHPEPIWAGRRVTPPPLPRPSGSTDVSAVPSLSSRPTTPLIPPECAAAGVIRPLSMMRSNSGSSASQLRAKRLAGRHSRSSSADKNGTVSSGGSSRLQVETRRSSVITEDAVSGPPMPRRLTEDEAPSRKYGHDVHPYRLSAFSDTSASISGAAESPSASGEVPLSRANSYASSSREAYLSRGNSHTSSSREAPLLRANSYAPSSRDHHPDNHTRIAPSRPHRGPRLHPSSPPRLPIPASFALASPSASCGAPYVNITSVSENEDPDDFGLIPIAGGFVRPLSPIYSFGSRGDLLSVPSDPSSSRANTLSSTAAISSLAFASVSGSGCGSGSRSASDPSRSGRSRRSAQSNSTAYLSVSSAATGGTFGTFGRMGPGPDSCSDGSRPQQEQEHGSGESGSGGCRGRGRRRISDLHVDEQGQIVDSEGKRRSFVSGKLASRSRSASPSGSQAESLSDDASTFETPPPGLDADLPPEDGCHNETCMTLHDTTITPGEFERTYSPHDEDTGTFYNYPHAT
ncbi:hypothetical protein CONPUDRAFT_157760 [Coniophora puteana RWD-64-598 SS2]|uniref:Uncharacterized protein n=1 Tax=Coniophora puteana (strain RWD-64-598) TaxID=741705 RepID=A0A5M3MBW4_CONPW|nr:uncharacterized protein CONPUDRAFT_157760 [Coniophora puteana RWD-64-598 SS2]EIW76573.1 hypothetical protein CONPUDRAFT_157760 [Coniophora puteana RWD-64-598 SS2]